MTKLVGWAKKQVALKQEINQKIYEYLVNLPFEANPPTNKQIAKALKISEHTVGRHLKADDHSLWKKVVAKRRSNIAKAQYEMDSALFRKATGIDRKPSVEAIKLWYEKLEGWKPKVGIDISKKHEISVKHELAGMTEEQILEYLKQDLLKMPKKLPELDEKDVIDLLPVEKEV